MAKRILISVVAMFALLLCAPLWAQGNTDQHPISTYVSLWGVPRAQWGEMAKITADDKATLDPLVANGTLLGYGLFENRVHSEGGYTHGSFFRANSLGNLLKALEVPFNRPFVTAPVLAASKH